MKKHLFFAATAALVLASCSSDSVDFTQADVLQAQDDNSVQFDTYMGKVASTRAYTSGPIANVADATTGVNALSEAEFGVFAYQTTDDYDNMDPTTSPSNIAPNFMYNQQITWNSSNNYWTYDPVKYWPNGIDAANGGANPSNTATSDNADKLSFFAYAPYKAMADFTTPGTGTAGTDFPTALSAGSNFKTASGTNGIIAMTTNEFTGNVWVKYLMPNATETEVVDLLWGTNGKTSYNETDGGNPTLAAIGTGYNMNLTKQIVGEKVKFLFKHALAKIGGATSTSTESLTGEPAKCGFKVVVDVDGNNGDNQNSFLGSAFNNNKTLVTLKEVKIQDGKTASDDSEVSITGKESDLYTSGWFNIEQGSWDMTGATKGATYNVVANSTDNDLSNTTYTLNEKIKEAASYGKYNSGSAKMLKDAAGAEWSTSNPTGVTATAQDLFCNENVPGLMVIPGTGSKMYVTVDYVVRTADPNLATGYTEVKQKITNEVSLASLQPNKYYTIIMHLGLTSVKFEAVVADWQTNEGGTYNENGEYTPDGNANEAKVWLPSNVVSYTVAKNVEANATNTTVAWNAELGTYQNFTQTGSNSVSGVSVSGGTATINLTANTTSSIKTTTATLKGTLGKIVVTITQAAEPITIGDLSGGKVSVSGPTDLALSSATITVVDGDGTNYTFNGSAASDTEYTYDNASNPKTITIPTATGKTYTITVTQNDATASKNITVTP